MALIQGMARLLSWESYRFVKVEQQAGSPTARCRIHLETCRQRRRRCSGCGRLVSAVHDVSQQRVRDLPIFEAHVEVIVPRLRLACPACGPKLEQLAWLPSYGAHGVHQ